jgi:hypothetical protein
MRRPRARPQAALDEYVELQEVKQMRQPLIPGTGATARLVGKALLVTVVLVMTLLLGQLVMQPAPVPAPPQGPVTPPIQMGTPSGPMRAE